MSKFLVIVESPAKAKTIERYLGSDFIVKSSVGHVRDLVSNKDQDNRMGIDFENWSGNYSIIKGREKVVKELVTCAKSAQHIYLATDRDREGEAIAWHLREVIGGDDDKYSRVVFNEITKIAITKAFSEPGVLDIDSVNAQQARRFLDRIVGFMVSPLLWKKVARGLSAGRVQSVAVRLVVEREREILAFTPEEFWLIKAETELKGEALKLDLATHQDAKIKLSNSEQAENVVRELKGLPFIVDNVETNATKSRPAPPFITSSLQQTASTILGFGVKRTMMAAQGLYESGYITYMRTDSTALSKEAVASCRQYLQQNFGKQYVPEKPRFYANKKNSQEAHEAIRPTSLELSPDSLITAKQDQQKLYHLIYNRFLACQAADAQYLLSQIKVTAGNYGFIAKGRKVVFDGFTKFTSASREIEMIDVNRGDKLELKDIISEQHFTKPVSRYGEASLVRELEFRGIGRPSTYASIVSTILDRGYVRLEKKRFYAERIGEVVNDKLCDSFADIMDYSFTARLEERLDSVASGDESYQGLMTEFWKNFSQQLDIAQDKMSKSQPVEAGIACDTCQSPMLLRIAPTGVFLGCSEFQNKDNPCKATLNLLPESVADIEQNEELESKSLLEKKLCSKCNNRMINYIIDSDRMLHVCTNTGCHSTQLDKGNFQVYEPDTKTIDCDRCSGSMSEKLGRFGKYMTCDSCANTRKILKDGSVAPAKMQPVPMPELRCQKVDDYYVLRDGAKGLFLAASGFPKTREIRAPLVREIKPHIEELDSKYHYLASAPEQDGDNLDAVVRFDAKQAQIYLRSEIKGKSTKWRCYYQDEKWVVVKNA